MQPKRTPKASQRIRYSFLKILTGSDLSRRRLPLMVAESTKPGPVVWLTGCGHGDEVGGMVVIHEIFKMLRKKPLKCGALHAFPLMNPIGFETGSRNITMSKEDLNRSFPGNVHGSLAERIAEIIFSTIMETKPDFVLDLHNDWMKSIPYAVLDAAPNIDMSEVYEKSRLLSIKTGFVVVIDTEDLHRTLSYSLLRKGVPALTLELGESFVVNETNVKYGVKSVKNLLIEMNMIESEEDSFQHQCKSSYQDVSLYYAYKPVCSTSGIIRFLAKPGDTVKKGQAVARIYNSFGKAQETLLADSEGLILGHSDSSVAFPGAPIMAFAIPENSAIQ